MLTQQNYLLAWFIYVFAAAGLLYVVWVWLKMLSSSDWRRFFFMVIAVLVLMPWYVSDGQDYLAPALLVALLDAITEGPQQVARAGVPLLISLIAAGLLPLSLSWLIKYLKPISKKQSVDQNP